MTTRASATAAAGLLALTACTAAPPHQTTGPGPLELNVLGCPTIPDRHDPPRADLTLPDTTTADRSCDDDALLTALCNLQPGDVTTDRTVQHHSPHVRTTYTLTTTAEAVAVLNPDTGVTYTCPTGDRTAHITAEDLAVLTNPATPEAAELLAELTTTHHQQDTTS